MPRYTVQYIAVHRTPGTLFDHSHFTSSLLTVIATSALDDFGIGQLGCCEVIPGLQEAETPEAVSLLDVFCAVPALLDSRQARGRSTSQTIQSLVTGVWLRPR
jgi:hypothetical protein